MLKLSALRKQRADIEEEVCRKERDVVKVDVSLYAAKYVKKHRAFDKHTTIQYNTLQYNTLHYNSIQYSTLQRNTA